MSDNVLQLVGEFLDDDPSKWGRLSSNIQHRRMELLLLREILIELRALNQKLPVAATTE